MDYLYSLQVLRESGLGFLNTVFVILSEFIVNFGPVLAVLVYWCISKRWGSFMGFACCGADLLTNTVKLFACVPRPWLRDSRLHVAEEVAESATGYSFPSGHTTVAASIYGSAGWLQRKRTWFFVVMIALALLTGFSRNWLGAHTLEDVLVGLGIGILCIAASWWGVKWFAKHESKDWVVLAGVLGLCVVVGVVIALKPYADSADYVALQSVDFWSSLGMLSGWTIGWFVERRWIRFDEGGTRKQKIVRGIVGVVIFVLVYKIIMKALIASLPAGLGGFLRRFVSALVAVAVYPVCIKWVQNRRAAKVKAQA